MCLFHIQIGQRSLRIHKGSRNYQVLTSSEFQDVWEDHSHQTSEWISAWLLQCWDDRAAVSSWRVRKSNSWDPSLETRELREWNRVSNLQSLEMVPLKCESKVPVQGRYCELARYVYLPQTKACILRELVVMQLTYIDLNNYEVSKDPKDVLCTQTMWRKCSSFIF